MLKAISCTKLSTFVLPPGCRALAAIFGLLSAPRFSSYFVSHSICALCVCWCRDQAEDDNSIELFKKIRACGRELLHEIEPLLKSDDEVRLNKVR
jgi:hypothetical protein